jgi:hypothetical protein
LLAQQLRHQHKGNDVDAIASQGTGHTVSWWLWRRQW